jgi:hypothetical protein
MNRRHYRGIPRVVLGFALVLLVVVVEGRIAHADSLSAISPNPQNVLYGATQIGTLQITTYQSTSGMNMGTPVVGAGVVAQFNQTYMPTCNLNLQWIQAIIGGQGTIGQSLGGTIPYLDPYIRDDNLPYYWTTAENNTVGTGQLAGGQPGSRFSDFPSQPITNGNSITFEAALVSVSPTNPLQLVWLAGFEWGYSIANNVSTVFSFGWTNGAGVSLQSAVTAWNGSQTNYPGSTQPPGYDPTTFNNSAGYTFVAAGTLPPCPLPSTVSMTLVLLIGLGGWTVVRPRLAARRAA